VKKSWIQDKVVLLTGASSGIGRELAKLLIEKNNCYVIGIGRNEEKFISFKSELADKSDRFEYKIMDVSIEENWKALRDEFQERHLDILINNAGVLPPFASFEKLSLMSQQQVANKREENDIDNNITECSYLKSIMDINFNSILYSSHYLCHIIEKANTPAIINICSSAGLCALPGISVYSASKGAVKNFTESLRLEKKYYVGLVCPGFTKTDIFRSQKRNYDSKLIRLIATDLYKMTKKIYRGIKRKKRRMVFGMDAKFMDWIYRTFKAGGLSMLGSVMKSAKIDLFKDIFE